MVKKRKHALFIVENNSVPFDVRVWNEAKAVREFGYEVSVICPKYGDGLKRHEWVDGVEIIRHPAPIEAFGKFGFMVEYLNALFWETLLSILLFVRKPFSIIHAANPPDHVFLIALLFKPFGTKFIFDHHDIVPENYLAKFDRRDGLYSAVKFMEKLSFKTSDVVISTNQSYKRLAVERGHKEGRDVFVVRNGPNLNDVMYKDKNDELKEGREYLVVYLGTIGTQEGLDTLLRAINFIIYRREIQNMKFVIIGKGPDLNNLKEMAADLAIEEYVRFTGYVPYELLYEYLSTADLCVNPEIRNSFTDKSTMIKIMDYMTFGKAIVMFYTKEGAVTAGESAVYVQDSSVEVFADTIIATLEDGDKRKQMGEFGKNRIRNDLNWDIQKKSLRRAYEHLEAER